MLKPAAAATALAVWLTLLWWSRTPWTLLLLPKALPLSAHPRPPLMPPLLLLPRALRPRPPWPLLRLLLAHLLLLLLLLLALLRLLLRLLLAHLLLLLLHPLHIWLGWGHSSRACFGSGGAAGVRAMGTRQRRLAQQATMVMPSRHPTDPSPLECRWLWGSGKEGGRRREVGIGSLRE